MRKLKGSQRRPNLEEVPDLKENDLREAFLKIYSKTGQFNKCARVLGMKPRKVKKWIETDPDFAADFDEAKADFTEILEEECVTRAVRGLGMPIINRGEVVMVWRNIKTGEIVSQLQARKDRPNHVHVPLIEYKKSDLLMMFMLKGLKPDMYRENASVDVTSNGKPVKQFVNINIDKV